MMDINNIPYLTTDQMVEVDQLMVDVYGIQLVQMMENAGRHLADLARTRFLDDDPFGQKVLVLAGSGGNGGGALVCARNLLNWGTDIQIVLSKPADNLSGVIKEQADILTKMGVPFRSIGDIKDVFLPDLIVDGIIGYSLQGAPSGTAAKMINQANEYSAPILSLDIPSGVNATTGEVCEPAIRASATMTLALPKIGLMSAPDLVGDLFLADIGVPPELYSHPSLNLQVGHIFKIESIIPLF